MACIARANRVAIQKVLPTRNLWLGQPQDAGAEPAASPRQKPQGGNQMGNAFIKVDEVAAVLGVSKSYAYKIVCEMNNELKRRGFITIAGRVSKQYFEEKLYGLRQSN